ncbi:MAG: penicillin-binding protein activator, partial [Pseudomonadota bacterium]
LAPTSAASEGVRRAAQDLVAAAQIARSERAPANMSLKIYDTRGDQAGAAAAAANAVRDGAAIILGPLLASSAEAVGPVAADAGLNVIAFSNDGSVAGGNVWVLGQTPGDEMRRVFAHAAAQGAGSVAIAYPQNRYGESVAASATAAARDAGVGVAALAGYPYDPKRGRGNFDQISAAGGDVAAQIRASGADAVLLADVGNDLASLGSFLNYFDVSPGRYRYLGLSRWGTRATLREPSLRGGVFAAADPSMKASFDRSFQAQMSRRPSTVAGVGYDAVVAAADMLAAAQRGGGGAFEARAITASSHSGATGDFVLLSDGTNRRGLAILQVAGEGFRIVEPAPRVAPGL